jgi:hypothetical protein
MIAPQWVLYSATSVSMMQPGLQGQAIWLPPYPKDKSFIRREIAAKAPLGIPFAIPKKVWSKATKVEGGRTNMKRALFLIATVVVVFMLSSCADMISVVIEGVPYDFENHSSHVVNVDISTRMTNPDSFTLQPGEKTEVHVRALDRYDLDYTYTPSDLAETGAIYYEGTYGIWDKGSPRPW